MDKEQYIGITEAGEPTFNLDIFDRLYKGNIIITKRLTPKLMDKLIEHKDKIILHCTCTGYGGTVVEPFVPNYETTYAKLEELINNGFPVTHVVLRVDPVIPTDKGINLALTVINKFLPLGIKRVRWSSLDMYKHVKERFEYNSIKLPYHTFNANKALIEKAYNSIKEVCNKYDVDVETCGEGAIQDIPCLSQKDINILGLQDEITLSDKKGQRSTCSCPSNKKELITGQKPTRCDNKCPYCYWKD